jgi:hypothetical protein
MLSALLLAASLTVVPDRARAELRAILAAPSSPADGCDPPSARRAADVADLRRIGTLHGDPVIIAALAAPCLCGNVNCPFLVLRIGATRADVLYSGSGYALEPFGNAQPLPNLRETSHNSALIHDETRVVFRNGEYRDAEGEHVRGDTGERKPDAPVPIRFAPGSSSIVLHGRVGLGWDDAYTFVAAKGQQVTIDDVTSSQRLNVYLTPGPASAALNPGVPFALPKDGAYSLVVAGSGESSSPYRLRLTIR